MKGHAMANLRRALGAGLLLALLASSCSPDDGEVTPDPDTEDQAEAPEIEDELATPPPVTWNSVKRPLT
jgi:hypothetical protein